MRTQKISKYVLNQLQKAKSQKIPRFFEKEINVYFYTTNLPIESINNSKIGDIIAIQTFLLKIVKGRMQNQPAILTSPEFENPADSSYWAENILLWIFEDLNLNSNIYNFFTFFEITKDNIKNVKKYRILRINPLVQSNNPEAWEIRGILENAKSFPAINTAVWNLLEKPISNEKVSFIEIELPPETRISFNGLQISTTSSISTPIYNRNLFLNLIEKNNAYILHQKIIGKQPLLNYFDEWNRLTYEVNFGGIPTINYLHGIIKIYLSNRDPHMKPILEFEKNNFGLRFKKEEANPPACVKPLPFFNQFIYFESTNIIDKTFKLGQDYDLQNDVILKFLNGNYFDATTNQTFPEIEDEDYQVDNNRKKLWELDFNNIEDRKYSILGNPLNFKQLLKFVYLNKGNYSEAIVAWNTPLPNFDALENLDYRKYVVPTNLKFVFELERKEFSPRINLNQIGGAWISLKTLDENREIINEIYTTTSNNFDESNFKTFIQM